MPTKRLFALASQCIVKAECNADDQWSVEQTLTGQDVRCIEVDPLNPDVIYAIVKSLAASPHQSGLIYAGTKNSPLIYRTRDYGAHWEELRGFRRVRGRWWWRSPAEPPFTAYVLALAISLSDPDVVLAGVELGAVVRSSDGGETWSDHRPGAGRDCHQLFFHPRQGSWAYQAHGGGPVISRDGGLTWKQPRAGLDARYCINVAADLEQPAIWYAVVAPMFKAHSGNSFAKLVRSTGGAWEKLGGGLPDTFDRLPLLASDPITPGALYLASGHGEVWHSTDGGDVWRQLPINLGKVWFRLIVS